MIEHPNPELQAALGRLMSAVDDLPQLEALAVGGSTSRRLADKDSDLDLICIIRPGQPLLTAALALLDIVGPVSMVRGPVQVPPYGVMVSAILPGLSICQLMLHTAETVDAHPMRRWSHMLVDRTGILADVTSRADAANVVLAEVVEENATLFWHRALMGCRAYRHGQLWRALGYLGDMQRCMLQLRRVTREKYDPTGSPFLPATRFERDLGEDVGLELGPATASYSQPSIIAAYQFSTTWFAEASQEIAHAFPRAADHLVVEQRIRELIGASPTADDVSRFVTPAKRQTQAS